MNELRTIASHVDYIRTRLRQLSDDTPFTDPLIYKALVDARARVIYQEINKGAFIESENYYRFCMPMQSAKYAECTECLPPEITCYGLENVMQSKYNVPAYIESKTSSMLRVMTLGANRFLAPVSPEVRSLIKYSKVSKFIGGLYELVNKNLYAIHAEHLVLVLDGIWYDPSELADIKVCDSQGNETGDVCYDIQTSWFPLSPVYYDSVYDLAINYLFSSLRIPDDVSNDDSSRIQTAPNAG